MKYFVVVKGKPCRLVGKARARILSPERPHGHAPKYAPLYIVQEDTESTEKRRAELLAELAELDNAPA